MVRAGALASYVRCKNGLLQTSRLTNHVSSPWLSNRRLYSTDTPPEELQGNVPALSDNIDMKNISLQVTGGRSSVSGIRATVFGASGTLGSHIVNQLGQIGSQVVIPYRGDGRETSHMKLMGDLGQIVPLPYQIRDKRSVERVIKGSNVVINCISRKRETNNFNFHDTHVNSTHMIARTAAELGVERFIQVSVANCSPDSPSAYFRTKWHGEQVAKAFYPEATIIRPSLCFGNGDFWFNRMAMQWFLPFKNPKIINGKQILQPCHFLDVARAVICSILDPLTTKGKTYSIYGPVRATKEQFFGRTQEVLACHNFQTKIWRDWDPRLLEWFYKPIYPLQKRIQHLFDFFRWYQQVEFLNYEDIQLTKVDMYPNYKLDPNLLTLEDLGIKPEDYFYWEARLLEIYFDRHSTGFSAKDMARREAGWGGPVPSTSMKTFHNYAHYGYRTLRRGGYDLDWWAPDIAIFDFEAQDREKSEKVQYGSDIDGNDKLKKFVKEGKVGYV